MDYSLLLGIHHTDVSTPEPMSPLCNSYEGGLDESDVSIDLDHEHPYLTKAYLCQGPRAPAFVGPKGLTLSMFQLEEGGFASTSDFPHAGSRYSIPISQRRKTVVGRPPPTRTLPLTPEVERKFSIGSHNSATSRASVDSWVQPIFISPPIHTDRPSFEGSDSDPDVSSRSSDIALGESFNPLHGLFNIRDQCTKLENTRKEGPEPELERGNEIYFFGIIDILQKYNTRKRLESSAKSLFNKSDAISAVAPEHYARRFLNFMDKLIE
ncbi:hypothetical protein P9112_004945 [Eukaryota sp. TZLM1-RC]